jgi:hypothetical protein
MKGVVFFDRMLCGSGKKNRRFGGYRPNLQGIENLSLLISHRGCASRQTAKRASSNGISTAVFFCYRGAIVGSGMRNPKRLRKY